MMHRSPDKPRTFTFADLVVVVVLMPESDSRGFLVFLKNLSAGAGF